MIYLGLDQALRCSGYSIFDDNKLKVWGTFETNNTQEIEVRLFTIYKHLDKLYADYSFEHVFFEEVQKQVNVETFKRLCYVQAIVMIWCYKNNINFTILSPSHWRKIIKDKYGVSFGCKREEQKQAALKFAEENYDSGNQEFTSDEADAICIGAAGYIEYNKNRSAW